jgi:hypothetical protein
MINSELPEQIATTADDRVDRIVAAGPRGALALAGIATAIVIAMWFAFYLFVFLPRGALQ